MAHVEMKGYQPMEYKQDWGKARANLEAWWKGEDIGRPAMLAVAPRNVPQSSRWDGWMLVKHRDDVDYVVNEYEKHCGETWYGAEAVPNLWLNLGPGILSAYFGIEPQIREETVWFEPDCPLEMDEILERHFEESDPWWQTTLRLARELVRLGKDKFFVGTTDLNSVPDVLGQLRNVNKLLMDLLDCPEKVREMSLRIKDAWLYCFNTLSDILQPHNDGTLFWMNIWCPERSSDTQCDFSAMISPNMFKQFALPELEELSRVIPRTIYHWDGPGQIPHLDMLLDIEELDGIQWVPGAGEPACTDPKWYDLYRRIQDAGKLLVLHQVDNRQIKDLLGAVSRKGLLIGTSFNSVEEAEQALKNAEKWSHA